MGSPTSGRSSAPSSKGRKRKKRRPDKQAKNTPAQKKRGGNPKGKGHRSKTTWSKGQSGNRRGRPPKPYALADIAAELAELKDINTADGKKLVRKRAVVEKLYSKAIVDGDLGSIKMLWGKLEGIAPPSQQPQSTEQQIWAGVMTLMRKVTDKHPELKQEILDAVQDTRANS
jgi:hypothetical protein